MLPHVGPLNSAYSAFSTFHSTFIWAIGSIVGQSSFIEKQPLGWPPFPISVGRLSLANPQSHLQRRKQGWGREKALSFSAQLTTQDVWIFWNKLPFTLQPSPPCTQWLYVMSDGAGLKERPAQVTHWTHCAEKGGGSTLWIAMRILLRCKAASTNLGPELQGGRCAHYSTISYPWGFPRRSMKEMRQAHAGTCLLWPSVSYLALACLHARTLTWNKFSVWVSAMVTRVVWMPIWQVTTLLHQTYPTVEWVRGWKSVLPSWHAEQISAQPWTTRAQSKVDQLREMHGSIAFAESSKYRMCLSNSDFDVQPVRYNSPQSPTNWEWIHGNNPCILCWLSSRLSMALSDENPKGEIQDCALTKETCNNPVHAMYVKFGELAINTLQVQVRRDRGSCLSKIKI